MRLRRIEAVSFGALADSNVGDLGDGLTVVLGPNESGKSSYTALVRHVLYGFPERRGKERTYLPPSGHRHGKLVFEDAQGRWLVERTEGARRGPLSVRTLSGRDRPDLAADVTRGVSEATFRIVFGFGLEELAEIEQRSGDDIIGRLYAAGAGLGVSPLDIRKQLEGLAGQLYLSSGQKPLVNTLARETRQIKADIRELEDAASAFASDQARLYELDELRAPLVERLEELSRHSRQLALDVERLHGFHDEALALEPALTEQRRNLATLDQRIAALVPDEGVLGRAVDLDVLLGDLPAFRQRLTNLREHEAALAELDARITEESRGLPEALTATPDLPGAIEGWRVRLGQLEAAAGTSRRNADKAAAAVRRLEESAAEPTAGRPGEARRGVPIAPLIMLALGALAVAYGLLTPYIPMAVFGALLAIAGAILAVWRPGADRGAGADRAASDLTAEVERERRTAAEFADEAEADALGLETARAEWKTWLDERGFPPTVEDAAAARAVADRILERDRLGGERAQREAEVAREREAGERWARKLSALCAGVVDVPDPLGLDDVALLAARAAAALEAARATQAERSDAESDAVTLRDAIESGTTRLEWLRAQVEEIARRADLADEDPLVALEARAEQTAREERDLREHDDGLARERHELAGKLGAEGRESAMADARQRLESVKVQAIGAADRYVTIALASALLARAQERYERDRQPEVTRRAGEVLSTMTAGRYTRVQVPLGGGEVVIGSEADVRPTRELSRGTAEQLYLALRIGLVDQLGAVGESLPVLMDDVIVNFDAERRQGAAQAIAELAARRQVVFFTCHESTAELLSSVSRDSTLVSLDRCVF